MSFSLNAIKFAILVAGCVCYVLINQKAVTGLEASPHDQNLLLEAVSDLGNKVMELEDSLKSNQATSSNAFLDDLPDWVRDDHAGTLAESFKKLSENLTDKSTAHTYQIMYHKHLSPVVLRSILAPPSSPEIKFRMLEIGLGCSTNPGGGMLGKPGGSTFAWRRLFSSSKIDLELHVMEYDAKCAQEWAEQNPEIANKVHSGDASSIEDLDRVYRDSGGLPFDMIIDDASHINEHQIDTFQHMIQYVAKGGIYVIEDIHSSCMAWPANTGTVQEDKWVRGTKGCMQTKDGKPTFFSKLIEWQKPLLTKQSPFPDVSSIEIAFEAAVITKKY